MTRIDPSDLEIKWPAADYEAHDDRLAKTEGTSEKYLNWLDRNKAELFQIYMDSLYAGNEEALRASWIVWSRTMFLRYDLNQTKSIEAKEDAAAVEALLKELAG